MKLEGSNGNQGLLPESLRYSINPPEPEVWPSLLRAAHYWGHRGNQVTFQLGNFMQRLPAGDRNGQANGLYDEGITYYSLAVAFRAANFRLLFPNQYQNYLADLLQEAPNLPDWLSTWNPENIQANVVGIERFTSPSQAVGDIAHQYRGIAVVQLWGYLYRVFEGVDSSVLEETRWVMETTFRLWERAKELLTSGEKIIRYYAWIANLETMLELAENHRSGGQPLTWMEVERRVIEDLDSLESQYGITYPWAKDQALAQINQYYTTLSNLRQSR
jgi:hypothetical protein